MKDLLEKLQELGLTGREAEVYLALLKKNVLSAPEVSKVTTITRTKSYEILQNLVKKGLCNETYKNGIKVFSSVEPTIAIQNMLSVIEGELTRKKRLAEHFREDLVELYKINENNNDPLDYIEVLTDVGQIRERWLSIQDNTKKEMLAFTKPPYATPTMLDDTDLQAEMIDQNKIVIKNIYEYQNLNTDEIINLIKVIEAYQNAGEQARIIKELPMKLVICDNRITMLALNDRVSLKQSITTIIVDHPSFARAQREVFYAYWEKAISVEEFKKELNEQKNSES
jgi:HTH-type transcriptional regulator, sugar sensing transcriptional regulator